MINTRLGAVALILGCAAGAASAQDVTWGCTFDKFSGKTYCLEVDARTGRNTGDVVVSRPNVGLTGNFQSIYGEQIRVVTGGREAGNQPFKWQK